MFAAAVQKLQFMTVVIFAVLPTLNVITDDILVVSEYRVKRPVLLVFWYWQRLVHNLSSTYIFCQSLPPLQRGLSATAELLVWLTPYYNDNERPRWFKQWKCTDTTSSMNCWSLLSITGHSLCVLVMSAERRSCCFFTTCNNLSASAGNR